MFTTEHTFVLNAIMMTLALMERGGQALRGSTAHGGPSEPLQFDRLEVALATTFH
jgi:hypothetical protein